SSNACVSAMERVLVVDDDWDTIQLYEVLLSRGGHQVTTECDNARVVALARENPCDVIVLDDHFPAGPTGRGIIPRLRAENIPTAVVAVSGVGTIVTTF